MTVTALAGGRVLLHHGDCLDVLRSMPDCSVDSIVTDPPYGLSSTAPAQVAEVVAAWSSGDREHMPTGRGFMGKSWDSFIPPPAVWDECLRVLKPGGHMLAFAGSRTQDLMGLSIRLAGFEIRDTLMWVYGSGFPKSMDIGKAIDKAAGAERDSAQWGGWGTALKPANEPIIMARKPLDGTVAANTLAHGVGGLNIDASRVPTSDDPEMVAANAERSRASVAKSEALGRWPSNVLLDPSAAAEMDRQAPKAGAVAPASGPSLTGGGASTVAYGARNGLATPPQFHADSGGASRFFHTFADMFKYQAKATKAERPLVRLDSGTEIGHPTVKPVALMAWLVGLVTPPGGVTLDPFSGSGSTLQAASENGFLSIGVERDPDYVKLIAKRLHTTTEKKD